MGPVVNRILPVSREDSLALQKCDPLDDFRRCIDAINNRHAANVVSMAAWADPQDANPRRAMDMPSTRLTKAKHV